MSIDRDYKFCRSGLFYPHVIQFITALHGLDDLLTRGLVNNIYNGTISNPIIPDALREAGLNENIKEVLLYRERPLLFDFSLFSKQTGRGINIDIKEMSIDLFSNALFLMGHQVTSAHNLIVSCFEISHGKYDIKDALWNFFYHCRNASAHGGRLNIRSSKRRFPAIWGNLKIEYNDNGKSLFNIKGEQGILGFGDSLILLSDIESKYIIDQASI